MNPSTVLTFAVAGGGLLAISLMGSLYSSPGKALLMRDVRRRCGIILALILALFGYLIWERQAAIHTACMGLRLAITWTPDPPMFDALDFERTRMLLEKYPSLHETIRVCRSATDVP